MGSSLGPVTHPPPPSSPAAAYVPFPHGMHRENLSPLRISAAPSPVHQSDDMLLDGGQKFSSTRVRSPRAPRTTSGSRPPPRHRATTTAPRPATTPAVLR